MTGGSVTKAMRKDWDERARKNAFHYIASWRLKWDDESFLSSGEEDFARLVTPVLERCRLPTSGGTMLELGCGVGRMTHSFAKRYQRVYAFDLSQEMLGRAREIHKQRSNILWLRGNGSDLSCLASGSVDFVFSYLVLQHFPQEALAFRYVEEFLRVLRSGGTFLFQFNGGMAPTMNLRGRTAWGIVDALWSVRLRKMSQGLAAAFGFDPNAAGKSWRGVAINARRMTEEVKAAGGDVRELRGENTPMVWCCGVKSGKQG
jgi:ubiquinone/menaquinone biosynthesis C-methylase UbiE